MRADEAFTYLITQLDHKETLLREEGAECFRQGHMNKVQEFTRDLEQIAAIRRQLENLHQSWSKIIPENEIIPPVQNETQHTRTARGTRTPEAAFIIPLLEALVETGGAGSPHSIKDRVGEKMAGILNDIDREIINPTTGIRWRNTCGWCRLGLVHQGLLKGDSVRGVWEISQDGRAYLDRYRNM